jgi:hypothetical protein
MNRAAMIDNCRRGADGARRRPSVALVGIHGYGTAHLRNILRLQVEGALRFVALVDPTPIDHLALALVDPLTAVDADAVRTVAATPWCPDLAAFLADPAAARAKWVWIGVHTTTSGAPVAGGPRRMRCAP